MATKRFPKLTECALCLNKRPLQESHIIPKFFGKELKKRSNSQTLVDVINPKKNPRPQDTAKVYLLCRECELLISKSETLFRNNILPANKSRLLPINYEDWMLSFAVSISWRVLAYLKYAPSYLANEVTSTEFIKFIPSLIPEAHDEAEKAFETWGQFLLGQKTNIGQFKQHLLVLNGKNFPHEYRNSVGYSLFQDEGEIATHAQMGPFIILGFIRPSAKRIWINTEINPTRGQIGIQQTIPDRYATWLKEQFQEIENVSLSDWKRRNKPGI